jgi:hypothetical protein
MYSVEQTKNACAEYVFKIEQTKKNRMILGFQIHCTITESTILLFVLQYNITHTVLTGLQLRPHICGLKKGSFFKGAYFPQKLAQKTSIGTQYKLFQRHVSFYILKISEGCFVWDAILP